MEIKAEITKDLPHVSFKEVVLNTGEGNKAFTITAITTDGRILLLVTPRS